MSLPLPCAAAIAMRGTFLLVFGVGGPQGIGIGACTGARAGAARATVADCSSSLHPTDSLRTAAAISVVGLLHRRRQGLVLMLMIVAFIVVHRNVGGYCRSCLCRPCCHRNRRLPHIAGDAALVEALLRPDGGCICATFISTSSSTTTATTSTATMTIVTVIVIHAQAQADADAVAAEGDAALAVPPIARHPHSGDLGIPLADHPLGYPVLIPPVLYHSLVSFIAVYYVGHWYWY